MLWKGFQKPKRLEVDRDEPDRHLRPFSAQPFERGFGTTVGNALRRVLLSCIEGAAITAVRVEGVLHEFSPIPGAMEDTTDLILNLKRVPLKMHVEHPQDAHAQDLGSGRGAGQAHHPRPRHRDPRPRGLHRDPRPGLDALRRDARQAGPRLRLRRQELRRGPLDRLDPGRLDRTRRCKKVNYFVENARVGQATDYEKLTLEVWTNGAVTPRDAVGLGAQADEGPPRDLHQHRRGRRGAGETPVELSEADREVVVGEAGQERRRDGAVRALLQLPQERQHPHHRRAGPEDRGRDAQDQELRPEVAERDQGDPGRHGPLPRHEAGQLPGAAA